MIPGYGGCEDCGAAVFMVSVDDRKCRECYGAAGLEPPTTGPYIPWYERMTPEQMAEIRARKWRPPVKRLEEF